MSGTRRVQQVWLGTSAACVAALGVVCGCYTAVDAGPPPTTASTGASQPSTWQTASWTRRAPADTGSARSGPKADVASGPPLLSEVGRLAFPHPAKHVRVSGPWLYATSGDCEPFPSPYNPTCEGRLTVISIADSGNPEVVGEWTVPNEHETIVDLVAKGEIAYVVVERRAEPEYLGEPAPRMEVLDVSDPTSIVPIARVAPEAPAHNHRDIAAYGDYIYWVTSPVTSTEGVAIVSVEDPASAELVGSMSTTGNGVAFTDGIMWLSREGPSLERETVDALRGFELEDPTKPALLSMTAGSLTHATAAERWLVAVHPYSCSRSPCEALYEYDVGEPTSPAEVWTASSEDFRWQWSFAWLDSWLLVGQGLYMYGLDAKAPETTFSRAVDVADLLPEALNGGLLTDMSVDGDTVGLAISTHAGEQATIVIMRAEAPGTSFLPLAANR